MIISEMLSMYYVYFAHKLIVAFLVGACNVFLHGRIFCAYTFTRLEPLRIFMGRHFLGPRAEFNHLTILGLRSESPE